MSVNAWGDYFYMEALTRLTSDWDAVFGFSI